MLTKSRAEVACNVTADIHREQEGLDVKNSTEQQDIF